ncbi:hypothetical protein [Nonomuraea sp. SYSU D8015]|uniref:hypothetical protein n=1 Tax=Nonomuraea sp. SYSU D8015 TaxID=2593644 RepID=UPI00166168D2|nr:hypothetical protein [Nonomuraea sp. SYSU D8015]
MPSMILRCSVRAIVLDPDDRILSCDFDPPHVWTTRLSPPGTFSPRDLATPLTALNADGAPARPVQLGL